MVHPTVESILAGEADAHVARCTACRKLAGLLGAELPADERDLAELPRVEDGVYTDWSPLADGRGGMGRIFRARDRRLGRFVAIKQLSNELGHAERAALVQRFEREARLTARLQHPAIVGVHEAGRFGDGEPFYAMPLMTGVPLSREIGKRATLAERLGLLPHLTTIAEAVAYAHEQGIVHRDIKPDNILIGAFGETVLIDWGLAKQIGDASDAPLPAEPSTDGLTQLGVGTPQYMPPEQARGETPDPRVDVYALGATLYHAIAGVPPFGSTSRGTEVRRELATSTPRTLAEVVPDVPRELADIVARAMARDRGVRFASAQALADELRRFQTGQLLQTRRYTLGELIRHFARRYRTMLRISAIATVLLLAIAVFAFVRVTRERDRAAASQVQAERELRRAQGTIASQRAADPARRLEAIELGVRAITPELHAGEAPVPEALQGLVDALAAGPVLVPLAHTGRIKSFTRAGGRIYGVDDARALVVWDAQSGALLATHPSTLASPELAGISPDGKSAFVCGYDKQAELVELATGTHHAVAGAASFAGCAFLPDGRAIAAADAVTVRDPATGAVVEQFALPAPASGMTIGRTRVAVSTQDGTLWSWEFGQAPRTVKLEPANVLRFDPGERTLYLDGASGVVHAVDLVTLAIRDVHRETTSRLGTLAVNDQHVAIGMFELDKSRHTLVVGGRDVPGMASAWLGPTWLLVERHGPLAIVDVETGGTVLRLDAHTDETAQFFDGDRLATAGRDGPAFLWDLARDREGGMLVGHSGEIVALAVRGDAFLTASHDGTARIWRATGEPAVVRGTSEVTHAAWLDDTAIVVGDLSGRVRRVELATLAEQSVQTSAPISALAVSSHHVAFGALDGHLEVRDAKLASPRVLAGRGPVTALALSSTHLVSGHADGSTVLWDLATGAVVAHAGDREPLEEPDDHDGHASLAFTADGTHVLASRPAGHTLVLDARTLATALTLEGRVVAMHGNLMTAAAVDGSVIVYDLAARTDLHLAGHRAATLAAAFSSDGARLATASVDGSVRIWDLANRTTIITITPHDLGAATAVAFDGDWLVTGYASGAVRIHPTTAKTAHDRACHVLRRFGRGC